MDTKHEDLTAAERSYLEHAERALGQGQALAEYCRQAGLSPHVLYRVCQQLQRQDVQLSPGTAGTWVNAVVEAVLPLINLLHEELLTNPFVQMDETYLNGLNIVMQSLVH